MLLGIFRSVSASMSQASYTVKHSRDAGPIGRILARFGARHYIAITGISLIAAALLLPERDEPLQAAPLPATIEQALNEHERIDFDLLLPPSEHVAEVMAMPWQQVKISNGDSMAVAFKRAGLSAQDLHAVMQNDIAAPVLRKVMPGRHVEFQTDEEGRLSALRYPIDSLSTLFVEREGDSFRAQTLEKAVATRPQFASATIESSLFAAGQSAGLNDSVIMELAGIFGYDIDFALDLRVGDRFSVVYEERLVEGLPAGPGNILAAEFTNLGKTFRAVRYVDANGKASYYTPDGHSMRKAFLRMPVPFARVSSNFNLSRKHPILNRIRAHKGVDYAAPAGTPIYASGDGKISFVGTKGGYGRMVAIQHGGNFTTHYAHLSRYGKGISTGKRVSQGQVIGYVGSSGLATAPHLHYEFLVNGVHRNPRTVPLPQAEPVPAAEKDRFIAATAPVLATLDAHSRIMVADNQ
ncbi:peptidase M23 [Permianibacter aggregans]|uniref:Murein DD-endopeptidase MepM/ murein hydrolase activator NlpD n=2 Tax=Permianibacter aggregans TaxID=1510150 RepID=A0A4R6UGS7_9GAMM|nr:peptidase M23 [Permianibacter aggregans]TDQ46008.1 murein DD-endopeptidase MepM/ murein hydrolase activator NlpD [Permianibacter aggregans]